MLGYGQDKSNEVRVKRPVRARLNLGWGAGNRVITGSIGSRK